MKTDESQALPQHQHFEKMAQQRHLQIFIETAQHFQKSVLEPYAKANRKSTVLNFLSHLDQFFAFYRGHIF